jgi:DNA polymerase V
MLNSNTQIFLHQSVKTLFIPLVLSRVCAGFPSPAEDYIEGRIDLNRELIKNPSATFYVRVINDSMESLISPGELLVVDRMAETKDKDIVVARLEDELCVKRLRFTDDGLIFLESANPKYEPITITEFQDFEIWGKVLHSIQTF